MKNPFAQDRKLTHLDLAKRYRQKKKASMATRNQSTTLIDARNHNFFT